MPCFKSGSTIICTRGGAYSSKCVYCDRPASKLCDGPAPAGSGRKTCDKNLCSRCATSGGPGRDLCRTHAAEAVSKG